MKEKNALISILIPVHNEAANLEWHHQKIKKILSKNKLAHEIIYIEDGSTDDSQSVIKRIVESDSSTKYVIFSRNFGKEAAITAGLQKASGDAVMIIDADGQHPIEMIDQFIAKWREGYDVVIGVRKSNQGEGFIKSAGSKLFYSLLKLVDNKGDIVPGSTDFRLLDRKVVDEYNQLTERNRVSRNLIDWLGFKQATIPFDAHQRHAGVASYSYAKLVKLAIDGAIKHSTRPLKLIGILGILISSLSFVAFAFLLVERFILPDPLHLAVTGTAFLAIFLSFLVGIVLACQGLLALYVENIYYEAQNRPLFIIREKK
jgi:dolichol-phosphate mannosyltransferase